ncbi:hypothetical protein GCM10009608_05770 [Pseudonocardia alaniniphila]
MGVPTCHHCHTICENGTAATLTWVHEREPDGQVRWLCPDCTRRHLRDIEARLPAGRQ